MSLQHFRLCVDTASCLRTLTSRNGTVTCDCIWIIPLLVDTALWWSDLFFPQLPQCLCIHIQRTYWHTNGIPYKNNAFIKFPEFLDMEPFLYEPLEQHSRQNGIERRFFPPTAGNGDLNGYLDELVGSFVTAGNKRWAWNVFVVTTEQLLQNINPLNRKIISWILIIHTEKWGKVDKISSKLILCDHVQNSHDHSVLQKHWYYKEKFDADHSWVLKG